MSLLILACDRRPMAEAFWALDQILGPKTDYVIGVLHGATGTSHLLGVLPSLSLPSADLAVAYIAAFAVAISWP